MSSNQSPKRELRFGPILIIGNLLFALGIALFVSTADNLSVRGGGFSVYAGPLVNNAPQLDENGNPVQGSSSILPQDTLDPTESNNTDSPAASDVDDGPVAAQDESTEEASTENGISPTPDTVPQICLKPTNWFYYIVRPGETLGQLAQRSGSTTAQLQKANCLVTDQINYGTALYVPRNITGIEGGAAELPTGYENSTPIPPNCNRAPAHWLPYLVQAGENVFRMALNSSATRAEIVYANCLVSESHVIAGQVIYLPPDAIQFAGGGGVFPIEATPEPTVVVEAPTNTPEPVTETPLPTQTIDAKIGRAHV